MTRLLWQPLLPLVLALLVPAWASAAPHTFTILDVPGSSYTSAYGINNAGQIVGSFRDRTGTHGFLAIPNGTPVAAPEPASLFLLGSGLAGLLASRRRTRRATRGRA